MISPEFVESALHHPGECMFGGGSRDLIDTKVELLFDGRAYICREAARLIGEAAGLTSHTDGVKLRDRVSELEGELAAATELLADAEAKLEEAESLRHAIAFTLERGAVLDTKKGTVGLRHKPGQTRIDVARSLTLIERDGEKAIA